MQPPIGGGGPGGGGVSSQSPPFTLPIRYMVLGIIGFGLFALDLILQSVHLGSSDATLMPQNVALTHILTLGSLLAFVMGAVYQLSTVAFLIPLTAARIARWNFWVYTIGVTGLIVAMSWWLMTWMVVFATLVTLSICVYATIVISSILRTSVRGAMQGFVLSAHAYLMLAVGLAFCLVLSFHITSWSGITSELLASHILLAIGGFFTFLIIGFTFKLLPMFTLSHGFATQWQKWTLLLTHVSLWLLIAGVWTHVVTFFVTGIIAGFLAFLNHLRDIRGIMMKRMRKKIEPPIRTVLIAAVCGVLGLLLILGQVLQRSGIQGWQTVVAFYLLGVVTFTVMGYAYKIVPFLIWTKRYSKWTGTGKRPLIADLINLNHSRPVFMSFALGLIVYCVSSFVSYSRGVMAGCILIALAMIVFFVQLFVVLEPRKIGKELMERD